MQASVSSSRPPRQSRSPLKRLAALAPFFSAMRRSPRALGAATVLLLLLCAAIFAPWLSTTNPYDSASLDLMNSQLPPAWLPDGNVYFLIGTDNQGADLLSLILYGLRTSLLVGCLSVALSATLGTLGGVLSGYFGGWVDTIIMRLADIQFTFPAMLLALLIGGVTQSILAKHGSEHYAIVVVVLALGIAHWPHFARLVRASVVIERKRDYVAAARLVGRGHANIIARQVLPNVTNPIFVLATMDLGFAIMTEATLSFLGFGMPANQPSLGTLIKVGYANLFSGEWWTVLFPSLALVILLVAVNLFGDWLRDYLDPQA
ncbi:peptide/nickel transport system permease protein [Caballeronia udeis]|uniref:Peptide/nickel transport system permease protein n=2 Tax=Caballeronia udeis TaxID=1232866 RepID=A0ABW8MVW8_9BURK